MKLVSNVFFRVADNDSGACVRLKCEHDINLKHETKAREGVTQQNKHGRF
jgi:hypothetical protein